MTHHEEMQILLKEIPDGTNIGTSMLKVGGTLVNLNDVSYIEFLPDDSDMVYIQFISDPHNSLEIHSSEGLGLVKHLNNIYRK